MNLCAIPTGSQGSFLFSSCTKSTKRLQKNSHKAPTVQPVPFSACLEMYIHASTDHLTNLINGERNVNV